MSFLISHPDVDGVAAIPERALPAYAAKGWLLVERADDGAVPPSPGLRLTQPNRSASAAEWKTYAVVEGMPYADAIAATRDQLVEHYDPKPAGPAKRPQKNDSTETWRSYAVTRGMPRELADQTPRDGDDGLIAHIDRLDTPQEP